jgi:hypothetical protein
MAGRPGPVAMIAAQDDLRGSPQPQQPAGTTNGDCWAILRYTKRPHRPRDLVEAAMGGRP